jgi:ornithine carbamoyltransferase
MSVRHFLSLLDGSPAELQYLLRRAIELKAMRQRDEQHQPLKNRVLGMLFEKASTRTRLSFEAGMIQLGGQAIFLSRARYPAQPRRADQRHRHCHVAHARCGNDPHLRPQHPQGICRPFAVPVINGLSDDLHPCQLLADMQTFLETRGSIAGKTVAWVGDGNNMCNSYLEAAVQFDFQLNIACPEGYEPKAEFLALAGERARLFRDPREAVAGAHW